MNFQELKAKLKAIKSVKIFIYWDVFSVLRIR